MYVNNVCRYSLTWAGLLVTLIFFRNVILDVIRAGSSSVHWCLSENRVAVLRSSVTWHSTFTHLTPHPLTWSCVISKTALLYRCLYNIHTHAIKLHQSHMQRLLHIIMYQPGHGLMWQAVSWGSLLMTLSGQGFPPDSCIFVMMGNLCLTPAPHEVLHVPYSPHSHSQGAVWEYRNLQVCNKNVNTTQI